MKRILLTLTTFVSFSFGNAHAQIGWTLDQCRKHWGRENTSHPHGKTEYKFGSKIEKIVTFDQQGKVNDVLYLANWNMLKIPILLAMEEGITWEIDPDIERTSRYEFWIGKKDGVIILYARYFISKIGEEFEVTTTKW